MPTSTTPSLFQLGIRFQDGTLQTTAATSGGTPGGANGNVQGNNSGVFGGLPGSTIDFINGLLSLAPTGTGAALSVTGDSHESDIQDWYQNGNATPVVLVDFDGNLSLTSQGSGTQFCALSVEGSTGNPIAEFNSASSYATPGYATFISASDGSVTLKLYNEDTEAQINLSTLAGVQSSFMGCGVIINPSDLTTSIGLQITGDSHSSALQTWTIYGGTAAMTVDASGNLHLGFGLYDSTGSLGTSGQVLSTTGSVTKWITVTSSGGTVTNFSAGNLSPIFTSSVATSTTTPALTFTLTNAAQNAFLAGPSSGGAGAPTYRAIVASDIPALAYVTSVALAVPSIFSVSGSPVTSSGTITIGLATETANYVWAGPSSGSAATPTFRALVTADLPSGTGTVTSVSTGNLSPIFTASVATSTTTPALSFSLSNAAQNAFLAGPSSGGTGAPTYRAIVTADLPSGTGTVTSFSSGNLSPLFTTSVATSTTTPALSFTLSTQSANLIFAGPSSGTAVAPTFRSLVLADLPSYPWSSLGNAAANLSLSNAGFTTTFNQTCAVAWPWANTTAGTSTSTNTSPSHVFARNYWNGSASAVDTWTFGPQALLPGTNQVSSFLIAQSGSGGAGTTLAVIGNAGTAVTLSLGAASGSLSSTGTLYTGTIITTDGTNFKMAVSATLKAVRISSDSSLFWYNNVNYASGTADTSLSRSAAGVIAVGTGTQGSTAGNLALNRTNISGADHAGTATITAAATSVSVAYAANYTGAAAPVVVVTPTSDPLAAGIPVGYWVVATGSTTAWTGFTINIQTALTGNVTFNYIVMGKA